MRIHGWHIDGFGRFRSECVSDLPKGLVVVSGPNETGKTTLAHFLKGMLFGFPDGRSNKPRHPPLNGGALGGSVTLEGADGQLVTVTRGQKASSLRVTDASGAPLPNGTLDALLGRASADLFDNVFAVDLRELVELRALSDDQVRDRVYSAGILGAGRSARAAIDAIETERDALFKPGGRGSGYRLNELRDELRQVETELAEARRAAAGLAGTREKEAELTERIAALAARASSLAEEHELLRGVQDLWEPWQEARRAAAAEQQAGALPALGSRYEARLDAAVADTHHATTALADAEEARAARERAVAEITVDEPAVRASARAARLTPEIGAETQRRLQHEQLLLEVTAHRDALRQQLCQLGSGLDEAWLAAQPASVADAAALRAETSKLTDARAHLDAARAAHAQAVGATERQAAAVAEAEQSASSAPEAAHAAAHERVRQLLALEDAITAGAERHQARPAGALLRPGWLLGGGATALAAVLLATIGVATSASALVIAALVVLGLTAAAALAAVLVARPPSARRPGTESDGTPAEAGAVGLAAALGLGSVPLRGTLRSLQLDAVEAERATREVLSGLTNERSKLAQAEHEVQLAAARLAEAEQAELVSHATWQRWLEARAMPSSLDAQGASDYLAALREARTTEQAGARCQSQLDVLKEASAAFAAEVRELAEALGVPADVDPVELAGALIERCSAASTAAAEAAAARQRLADAVDAGERAAERCAAANQALDALLHEAGVSCVDEAREVLSAVATSAARRASIESYERALARRCGTRSAEAETLLAQADPAAWATRAAELADRLAEIGNERDELVGDLRDLQTARQNGLSSVRIPELEQEQACLLADLREAVDRWRVLCTARELLDATLQRYQRERQPVVVKRAERYFARITDGRYPHLRLDEGAVAVVDKAGGVVDAAALSRGTADQLYLCLRFALAGAFAEASPLPLLLDDVLVNVDGYRSPQLAQVIAEVAREHQVFLFTCHRWVVDLLRAAEPELREVSLPTSS